MNYPSVWPRKISFSVNYEKPQALDLQPMNNIMHGCVCTYNTNHQSHVLANVRFSLINALIGMQCSAMMKGSSFAQTLTRADRGLGLGTRLGYTWTWGEKKYTSPKMS